MPRPTRHSHLPPGPICRDIAVALLRADKKGVIVLGGRWRQACVDDNCETFGIRLPSRVKMRDLWKEHRQVILEGGQIPVDEPLRKLLTA